MHKTGVVGIMIYAAEGQDRNVFTDEKYQQLAESFVASGVQIETILYNNTRAEQLRHELTRLDGLLVWVNPIEQGTDRSLLDALLRDLQAQGVMVSTHPDTILKIGTKRVLFDTKDMLWGSDVELYSSFADFRARFLDSLRDGQIRVLKQFRGDGGNGVFKVQRADPNLHMLKVLHAKRGSIEAIQSVEAFFADFAAYVAEDKPLINQPWNPNLANGIVRCYMTADRVVGFGYQEINALYPSQDGGVAPGKRYYFTEACALFAALRTFMEAEWLGELMRRFALTKDALPVIWDADFFLNTTNTPAEHKYQLCEINVSCVSPFPESAIPKIIAETQRRLGSHGSV